MSEMLQEHHKKKSFLHRIVTGDEKWIHYDNPKSKKLYVKPGQPAKSTAKSNIHGVKVMLFIWWDQKGVLYYELLKPGETINGERYRTQLIRLKRDGKFDPTRLIAQTLPLLTTICSGQNRVPKIGLIHSWLLSRRSSFGMESTN